MAKRNCQIFIDVFSLFLSNFFLLLFFVSLTCFHAISISPNKRAMIQTITTTILEDELRLQTCQMVGNYSFSITSSVRCCSLIQWKWTNKKNMGKCTRLEEVKLQKNGKIKQERTWRRRLWIKFRFHKPRRSHRLPLNRFIMLSKNLKRKLYYLLLIL